MSDEAERDGDDIDCEHHLTDTDRHVIRGEIIGLLRKRACVLCSVDVVIDTLLNTYLLTEEAHEVAFLHIVERVARFLEVREKYLANPGAFRLQ